MNKPTQEQIERTNAINELIEEISKHSRRFFYNKHTTQICYFVWREDGLCYQDETNSIPMPIQPFQTWGKLNFINHGGTLMLQIQAFTDFIFDGKTRNLFSDYWGYDFDSMKIIHRKAKEVGFCSNANFRLYDYDQMKDIIFEEEGQ